MRFGSQECVRGPTSTDCTPSGRLGPWGRVRTGMSLAPGGLGADAAQLEVQDESEAAVDIVHEVIGETTDGLVEIDLVNGDQPGDIDH